MKAETSAEDEVAKVAQGLKILSVETRLRILRLLRERNLCVGALACQLGLSQGAVSQHLKILRDAGLVIAERAGYYMHYRVDEQAVAKLHCEFDELLEQLHTELPVEGRADEATSARCKKQEEEACARRKGKAGARRGSR